MLEKNKKGEYQVRTAHSLSPVPFIVHGYPCALKQEGMGLANVAPTVARLLELTPPPSWEPSILEG